MTIWTWSCLDADGGWGLPGGRGGSLWAPWPRCASSPPPQSRPPVSRCHPVRKEFFTSTMSQASLHRWIILSSGFAGLASLNLLSLIFIDCLALTFYKILPSVPHSVPCWSYILSVHVTCNLNTSPVFLRTLLLSFFSVFSAVFSFPFPFFFLSLPITPVHVAVDHCGAEHVPF